MNRVLDRLTWLRKRLGVMTIREVFHRVSRQMLSIVERVRLGAGWQPKAPTAVVFRSLFGDEPQLDLLKQTITTPSALRTIRIFDKEYHFEQGIDWHQDPSGNARAPLTYGKSINYKDDELVGDIKILWELSRHQHLVPLALVFAKSGDTRYRDEVVSQIDSWIEANPFGRGVHWCSSLELALRGIAWCMVESIFSLVSAEHSLLRCSKNRPALETSLYQHAYFIRHFLSLYSSANNHYIGELAGLFTLTRTFSFGHQSQTWANFAISELKQELKKQTFKDGVNKEQALGYHIEVMDYYAFVWAVCQTTPYKFKVEETRLIASMGKYLAAMIPDANLDPVELGDCDYGTVNCFGEPIKPYEELHLTYAHLFGGGKAECLKAAWYAKIAGIVEQVCELPEHTGALHVFPEGGYAIVRKPNLHLIFDAGSLGYPEIAAHGHADSLSINLAWDKAWWLIDPGTYCYHSDIESRRYFKGTRAHNTMNVDGRDQSEQGGPFLWVRHANSNLAKAQENSNGYQFEGEHDGYSDLGVHHKRVINLRGENSIYIVDVATFHKQVERTLEFNFHFHPAVDIKLTDTKAIASHSECDGKIVFSLSNTLEWQLQKGEVQPLRGWYSPVFGQKVPCFTLTGRAIHDNDTEFSTRIDLQSAS